MKYTNRTVRLGEAGLVQSITRGMHDFLYRVSTVKDPKWNIGDEVEIGGGRKCVYAKNKGDNALYASHGCEFTLTGFQAITTFATSHVAGDTAITIAADTHDAITEDELAGGFVIIFDGASDYYTTTRMITGNSAAAADLAYTIYLDGELSYAITSGTSKAEVYRNPYSAIDDASDAAKPKAGCPMAYVPASESYFWILKEGICWVAPQSTVGNDHGGVGVCWRHDGSIEGTETALGGTVPAADGSQIAGYVVSGSQAGNGPLINLKC